MKLICLILCSVFLPLVFGIPSENCYHNAIVRSILDQGDFSDALKSCRDGDDFNACRLIDVTDEKLNADHYVTFYEDGIWRLERCISGGDERCCLFYAIQNLINGNSPKMETWFRNIALSYEESLKKTYGTNNLCVIRSAPVLEIMKRDQVIKQNYAAVFPYVINRMRFC